MEPQLSVSFAAPPSGSARLGGQKAPNPSGSDLSGQLHAEYVLRSRDLTVAYAVKGQPPLLAIDGLTLGVKENEFLVILGPGQCGKTTLLNCFAGLLKPNSGAVEFLGEKITGPGLERGLVFQNYALFPWLTVEDNIAFGLKSRKTPKPQRKALVQKFIDLVGLKGFEKAWPETLSGGMRQRTGLARAYAAGPTVLLMDEPFGALDAQTRYAMEKELLAIWEKEKRTVVLVTNNIEEAIFLGDRVALLTQRPGRLKAEWPVDLPRPRGYTDPAFLAFRREISERYDLAL